MGWFLYDRGLRLKRVNREITCSSMIIFDNRYYLILKYLKLCLFCNYFNHFENLSFFHSYSSLVLLSLLCLTELYSQPCQNTAQKMKFSNKDFFSKCDHISTFTEKILIGKLHFLCSESYRNTKFFPLESLYKLLNSYCKLEVQLCFLSPLRNWYLILQKKKKMMDFILEFIIICRELLIC